MLFNGSTLKLIDFDISSKMESESLINKYKFRLTSKLAGGTTPYCPQEALYYDDVKGTLPITARKIDSYCWGMSMLQFLTDMSDAELEKQTSSMKTSFAESCRILAKIRSIQIPELGEKASFSVMKLIARCLEYSPCMRLSMEDVLASLVCPNEEFCWIIGSLSKPMENRYTKEIHKFFAESNVFSSVLQKGKFKEEKKILQNKEKVGNKIDPLLESAFKKLNMLLNNKEINSDPLFKQIVESKDDSIGSSGNRNLNSEILSAALMKNSASTKLWCRTKIYIKY